MSHSFTQKKSVHSFICIRNLTKDSFAEGTNQFILFELMWNCRIGVLDKHQVPRSNFWRYLTKPFFFNLELGLIERSSKLYRWEIHWNPLSGSSYWYTHIPNFNFLSLIGTSGTFWNWKVSHLCLPTILYLHQGFPKTYYLISQR